MYYHGPFISNVCVFSVNAKCFIVDTPPAPSSWQTILAQSRSPARKGLRTVDTAANCLAAKDSYPPLT